MKIREIIEFIDKLAEAATEVSGGVGLPIIGQVGAIVDTGLEIAKNVLDRVEDGKLVLGETDEAKLNAATEKLAAVNDELARQIAAS